MFALRKTVLPLIGIGLFLIMLFIIFIVISGNKIEVINDSKYYLLTYRNSKTFNKYLNTWGVWKKNNFFSSDRLHSVKKLKVTITDDYSFANAVRSGLVYAEVNSDQKLKQAIKGEMAPNGIYLITVYLNPNFINSTNASDNGREFLYSVFTLLYSSTHRNKLSRNDLSSLESITKSMPADALPFTVSIKDRRDEK